MIARINIIKIVLDHFKTLRTFRSDSKTMSFGDILLFIIAPLGIAFFLVYNGFTFEKQLGNLIAAVAIFGGFLFNLLAIIYGQLESIEKRNSEEYDSFFELRKEFIAEIHINISFAIVLSVFLIIGLLLATIDVPIEPIEKVLKKVVLVLDYFLLILFFLTLLMVLNRIYILLKRS